MKEFSCGDVVPGCKAHFQSDSTDGILSLVGAHAHADHGLIDIPATLTDAVRANIHDRAA